jgi:tetratricopeptide (TPR) repeat protein
MWRFWQVRSHLAEGRRQLSELLDMEEARELPRLRAPALNAIGGLTYWQNDYEATRRYYQEAHDVYSSLDDPAGLAESLHNLGFLSLLEHRPDEALKTHRRSLALYEQLGDESGVAYSKWANGLAQLQCRDLDEARRMALEAKETFDRLENWFGQSLADFILQQVERMKGNHEGALRMMIASLDLPGYAGDISSMLSLLELLADSYIALGDAQLGLQVAAGAEKARNEYGGGAPPELLELGDPKELARAHLSDEDIEAAWGEGCCLSLDETIALARKGGGSLMGGPTHPASSG